jgi:hypothetical protein
VKGERDGKAETKFPGFDIAEPHPIFCKYRKRRAQKEQTCLIFFFIPIFCCPNGIIPVKGKDMPRQFPEPFLRPVSCRCRGVVESYHLLEVYM